MPTITMLQLEAAINKCSKARPPVNYVLGPDLRVLATVWGEMIYRHLGSIELSGQPQETREVIERWHNHPVSSKAEGACLMPGTEGCEACQ